jgi:methionyl-tRNA formyltransferase
MPMQLKSGPSRARLLLIGQGTSALSALESLADRFQLLGVVRAFHPEEAAFDPVILKAQALGVRVFGDLTIIGIDALVSELHPDLVVVSSFSRILPAALVAKSRFINVHYAPLPRCRGMTTANWALINNDTNTGITIHTIEPGMDEGNILVQRLVPIRTTDTVVMLQERMNAAQREVLGDTVQRYLEGYRGEPQREDEATYVCTRVPADGEIDWSRSDRAIGRLVRALVDPFPGAFTFFEGRRLVVWKAKPVECPRRFEGRIPGRVVAVSRKEGTIDVLAGKGILRVEEVQREGEERATAAAVITSTRATLGLRVAEVLRRVEELEKKLAAASLLQEI